MRRLYLRIYLALLASLVVFAVLGGIAAGVLRLFDDRPAPRPWPETGAEIAEKLLPADRDPAALASDLAFWSERTGFSLALLSPDGAIVASAGEMPSGLLSKVASEQRAGRFWRARGGVFGLTLSDGRRVVAVRPPPGSGLGRLARILAIFLGIALAVAIGFYPLIRQLLRRLERLEAGVARFGEGDLSARVPAKGKDEIARLAATFNDAAARIQTLMNAHKMLLANASHELRSPLSRLRMAVERLKSGSDEAAFDEAARNIRELDGLVGEILLASRLEASETPLSLETVDVAGLLAEECARVNASFSVETNPVPLIEGDPRLLRRLFRNLLDNAVAYGGLGRPDITLGSDRALILVEVCDRGPGVPEEDREKVFEPFYQIRGRPGGGAGLGLALVRQIAAKHGGSVRCNPRKGGGACFEVRLPQP